MDHKPLHFGVSGVSFGVSPMACTIGVMDSPNFETFWKLYPRKTGRGAAANAWARATKKAPAAIIIEELKRHLDPWSTFDKSFIPYPATWLNQERWLDETPEPKREVRPPTRTEQARLTTQWFEQQERRGIADH